MDSPNNVVTLETLILGAVNTNYKETPPTEEEFLELAHSLRAGMQTMYPVSNDDFSAILRRLRSTIVIRMDVGVYIKDRNKKHQSWLPAIRADIDFFFWDRYKNYLETTKHWNSRVTATLGRVSDEIVDLLGNPRNPKHFQIRGLVLGDVQSGKTANYTAICNKAADCGYRIIIVLAGMMENLRAQTQERLDAEFSGRKSDYYLDPKADVAIKNCPVGVGRFGTSRHIAAFTSVVKDFDIGVLKSNNLVLNSVHDPVLLVVKKNKRILTNLISWLLKNNADTNNKIALPMLLIDDEADNASVNSKKPEDDPTAINAAIRTLLQCFYQASYLGITATPFANIFINPEEEREMLGDDLFPRDFIYALSPPTNYIGADKIFGDDGEFTDTLVPLHSDELNRFFSFRHKRNLDIEDLPPSLYESLGYFLLANAVRDYRGDTTMHRSMMVHVSRFTAVQNKIAEIINEWLLQVKSDIRNYSQLPLTEAMKIRNIQFLNALWEKHDLERISELSWENVLRNYLCRAITPIDVRAVNQETKSTALDYTNHQADGLRVIAVGGNSLSRGLTLEGLCVSYFYRCSQMYDTLLQMGRWFGYRPNYEDLFKIWIAEEAIDWYGYITQAANELKQEIAKMKAVNQTPADFGLKVRQDPNSLIATARNKMRTAKFVTRPITVSGRLLETPRLKADKEILSQNEEVVKSFLKAAATAGKKDDSQKIPFWHGVPKELVADLLLHFDSHPWHLAFRGRALSDYIHDEMDDTPWDVVITVGGGAAYSLNTGLEELQINTAKRKIKADDKMVKISGTKVRVGAGGCTKVGLSRKEIEEAEVEFRKHNNAPHIPDSAYLIKGRKPLLMLHIIQSDLAESDNKDIPPYLFALGVGFPDIGTGTKTANYMVNLVDLKNWMDPEEEEDA